MGVHVTFVRSVELDKWKPSEMEAMKCGGNGNARAFFRAHGITDMEKTEQKYHSRAAQMYRSHLKKVRNIRVLLSTVTHIVCVLACCIDRVQSKQSMA